ncbi:hypothetical protein G6F43_010648 [Rhizopus delemar]|nr:hypothetical protein G6F43_010648 [Rhizopus delemar]
MHSKGIPEPILLEIDTQLHNLKSTTSNPAPKPSPTTISIGDYYVDQGEGDLIASNSSEELHKKKMKVNHNEQEERDPHFYEKLASFLVDAEADKSFHKYSPGKNGVLKLTNTSKPRLPMSTSIPQLKSFIEALLYNASTNLLDNIEDTRNLAEYKAECRFV